MATCEGLSFVEKESCRHRSSLPVARFVELLAVVLAGLLVGKTAEQLDDAQQGQHDAPDSHKESGHRKRQANGGFSEVVDLAVVLDHEYRTGGPHHQTPEEL